MIDTIRQKAVTEEFDYVFLMDCLKNYSDPRGKISRLIKSKSIIRIKKGLYIFGPKYSRKPISKETLANLIYGPSYISLDYALSFYGLIPEKIEIVTNMTCKRNKFFETPIGNFSYEYISTSKYESGVVQYKMDDTHNILIASQEKALCDKIRNENEIQSTNKLLEYLTENLRIDGLQLKAMRLNCLNTINKSYKNKTVELLFKLIRGIK